jgi:hypothetical protein
MGGWEVIVTSPAIITSRFGPILMGVMGGFVETFQLGVMQSAPFQMKLEKSGREPDLLFLAEAHRGRLRNTFLDGPADLVVEILSPESVGRDRGEKFYEYEAARLPEYWLIDPQVKRAEFYQLTLLASTSLSLQKREGTTPGRSRVSGCSWPGSGNRPCLPSRRRCWRWVERLTPNG